MKMKNNCRFFLFATILFSVFALLFSGCNELLDENDLQKNCGALKIVLPYASGSGNSRSVSTNGRYFEISLVSEADSADAEMKIAASGEKIIFSDKIPGNYVLSGKAYNDKKMTSLFAEGSTVVAIEAGKETSANLKLSRKTGNIDVEVGWDEGTQGGTENPVLGTYTASVTFPNFSEIYADEAGDDYTDSLVFSISDEEGKTYEYYGWVLDSFTPEGSNKKFYIVDDADFNGGVELFKDRLAFTFEFIVNNDGESGDFHFNLYSMADCTKSLSEVVSSNYAVRNYYDASVTSWTQLKNLMESADVVGREDEPVVIELVQDMTVDSAIIFGAKNIKLTTPKDKVVKLTRAASNTDDAFFVVGTYNKDPDGTFILEARGENGKLVLDGGYDGTVSTRANNTLLKTNSGIITIEKNVILRNNYNTLITGWAKSSEPEKGYGGAICCVEKDGNFNFRGQILNCYNNMGGAIYLVDSQGKTAFTLNLEGGLIKDCGGSGGDLAYVITTSYGKINITGTYLYFSDEAVKYGILSAKGVVYFSGTGAVFKRRSTDNKNMISADIYWKGSDVAINGAGYSGDYISWKGDYYWGYFPDSDNVTEESIEARLATAYTK